MIPFTNVARTVEAGITLYHQWVMRGSVLAGDSGRLGLASVLRIGVLPARVRIALFAGVLLLGACAQETTPTVTSTSGASGFVFPLPTNGGMNACAGVGWTGTVTLEVRGGRTFGRFSNGRVKQIFWPMGFAAVEDPPRWTIVDPDGSAFAASGEDITDVLEAQNWGGWATCVGGRSIGVYFGGGG